MAEGQPRKLTAEEMSRLDSKAKDLISAKEDELAEALRNSTEGLLGKDVLSIVLALGQLQGLVMYPRLVRGELKIEDLEIGGEKGQLVFEERTVDTAATSQSLITPEAKGETFS